jgi:hypothetical protein
MKLPSLLVSGAALILSASFLAAQTPPRIRFDSDIELLKLPVDMNFGEVLGIAINFRGHIVLWLVDKGTMSVMRFNPAGRVTMNLGRSEEGPWIAYLQGEGGKDVQLLDRGLEDRQVLRAPAVLTKLLSDPKIPSNVAYTLVELPLIEIKVGYWQRAGELRSSVPAKRRKARLGCALIAQSCIDRAIPLLTRDRDFRAFTGTEGFDLVIEAGANRIRVDGAAGEPVDESADFYSATAPERQPSA